MLTGAEKPRATASRIKGKPAIVRSLRGLLLRVHRYGRGRARTPQDVTWAAHTLDALGDALAVAEGASPHEDRGRGGLSRGATPRARFTARVEHGDSR
jgi:hypothetical protein